MVVVSSGECRWLFEVSASDKPQTFFELYLQWPVVVLIDGNFLPLSNLPR
jgi:hypothetical protein